MPLVVSPTSSEDVSDVEELRLARVVVDAVVVVADVDVAVVHEGHALDLLVKQATRRQQVGHEVLDERLRDRGRRELGPGGGRELVDALDAGVGPELVVALEDEELAPADERDVRQPDPAAVRRLGRVEREEDERPRLLDRIILADAWVRLAAPGALEGNVVVAVVTYRDALEAEAQLVACARRAASTRSSSQPTTRSRPSSTPCSARRRRPRRSPTSSRRPEGQDESNPPPHHHLA